MKKRMTKKMIVLLTTILIVALGAAADTLRLKSGQTIPGTYMGGDTRLIRFMGPDGQPRTYPLTDVESISFAPTSLPSKPAPQRNAPPPPAAAPSQVVVPAGTPILIRMIDSLDTSKTKTGQLFSATLETNLAAGGVVVAKKGTTIHGKVTKSGNARRLTGKSELQLELKDIVINGTAHPIATSGFQSKGKSEGAQTLKKTAGGAGLGAIIGGISGDAGKGAAIGATAGLGLAMTKKGEPIRVPSESLLEFSLKVATTLPVAR